MKIVAQRVKKAKVAKVQTGSVVGEINKGLFLLVRFKKGDTENDVEYLGEKISKLRVMGDDKDKMNLSVPDVKGEILVVSQFTLYADTSGGNRPSFIDSEEPEKARKLYEHLIGFFKNKGISVATGSFGDYMEIDVILDGPVTIVYSR